MHLEKHNKYKHGVKQNLQNLPKFYFVAPTKMWGALYLLTMMESMPALAFDS